MNEEKRIIFSYSRAADYRTVAANGVYGGISPRGDFKMDFFVESNNIPEEVHHSLTMDGIGPEIERLPNERKVQREVQVSVLMAPAQAKSFAHWILERVSEFEKNVQRGKQ